MNIIKNKKTIATTLTFVLVMTLAGLPLPAKERRGSSVVVTMTAGRGVVKGELLAVKADTLLVYDQNANQGKSIDLKDVFQVKVLKKSKVGEGLLIGLGVGLVVAVISYDKTEEFAGIGFLTIPPMAGLCGGLFGALSGIHEKFSLAGASSHTLHENLNRLKRYAREQD